MICCSTIGKQLKNRIHVILLRIFHKMTNWPTFLSCALDPNVYQGALESNSAQFEILNILTRLSPLHSYGIILGFLLGIAVQPLLSRY